MPAVSLTPIAATRTQGEFMLNKTAGISLALGLTSLCVINLCRAQGVGPVVEIPTTHGSALIDFSSNENGNDTRNLTVASEFKSTAKNVVEEEKPAFWNWAVDLGYVSEYNFRGTNLTPDAAGAIFMAAEVTKWNFTLGAFGIRQVGEATADAWAMGESGGGGGGFPTSLAGLLPGFALDPVTTQRKLDEIDVFLNYNFSFRWFDLTVGNVAFFIDRDASTDVTLLVAGLPIFHAEDIRTVQDEQFDRLFVRLSTSKIPYVTPSVTYYQTIYNAGQDARPLTDFFKQLTSRLGLPGLGPIGPNERNDELGGFLEGKLRGNFPVTDWLTINPYGVISYSFHDRTEPISNPQTFRDLIRGRTLVGWNVAQAGLELPIKLAHFMGTSGGPYAPPDVTVYFVPSGWYSHHISDPTPGTDRNEWWGGAKFTVTF
jgi:hypothetical protein